MRIYQPCCVAVMAAITLLLAPNASAQEESIVAIEDFVQTEATQLASTTMTFQQQIEQFEARLAQLESKPGPVIANRDSCPIPSRRIATNSLRCAKNYAGFELAVLKAHTGSISSGGGVLTPEYDYSAAPRVFFGHERCDGLGWRVTYFNFNETTDDVGFGGITTELEIHALDLELTSHTEFCGSDLLLSAGLRYGDLDTAVIDGVDDILEFETDGIGPTIGVSIRRNLGQTPWKLVAGARGSLLLTDTSFGIPTVIDVDATDSTMQIWEARIATQRTRQLKNGAELVTEFGFEAQNWQSGSILGVVSPNFGLAGPTFRIGLNL